MYAHRRLCNSTPLSTSSSTASSTFSNTAASIRYTRFFNNVLRSLMMIVFGLANLNNGLTSMPNINIAKANLHDEPTHRSINQNLIMSAPAVEAAIAALPVASRPSGNPLLPLPAALTATSSSSSLPSGIDMVYPSSSITATSSGSSPSLFHQTSGSSITSFDSGNVIDEQRSHTGGGVSSQYRNANAKDGGSSARPIHKIIGVSGGNTALSANHIEPSSSGEAAAGNGIDGDDMYAAPMYFGTENSTVVTTQIGATAHIPCTVHHIGEGVVSWIRKKDYHLLTVGLTTYSSDERFSATHLKHSEDWTLQIKFVQLRDAGVYECQVSTHPPTSIFLHLTVVEARAEISGPPIRYLTPGSTLRLQCRVVQNTEASEFIFWYHDNRMINYDIDRGINVSTEPDFQSSELTILKTRREHSGNFTCVASNTQPASVLVHIFKGDNPAAMYHGNMSSSTKPYQTFVHCVIIAYVSMAYRIWHTRVHLKIV